MGRAGRALAGGALCLLLAACSSTPPRADAGGGAAPARTEPRAPARVAGAAPAAPLPTNPRGGYYGDDGPPEVVPPGLELTPDAVPRIEPLRERANRPYTIFGRPYVPMTHHAPYRERGRASWYGRKFHGQSTSIGETYDMFGMSAAHPTLPLPSYVRVTNLRNGRNVVVRVNDRGPFLNSRLIDLSYTAALKLGYVHHGSTDVEVELILPQDRSFRILQASADNAAEQSPAASPRAPAPAAEPVPTPALPPQSGIDANATPATAATPPDPAVRVVVEALPTPAAGAPGAPGAEGTAPGLPSAADVPSGAPARPLLGAAGPAAYLQLGAFASRINAEAARHRASGLLDAGMPIDIVEERGMFKLVAGPLSRRDAAQLVERIQQATGSRPFTVSR